MTECPLLHVIHIARVGHLLEVDASFFLAASESSDDAVLNDVLQVGEAAPDVAHVLKRVRPGTRIPIPAGGGDTTNVKVLCVQAQKDSKEGYHLIRQQFNQHIN